MRLITSIALVTCLFILSACGSEKADSQSVHNFEANQQHVNLEEASNEERLEFERKYTPIVDEEMNKLFPNTNPAENPFERFGIYFLDTRYKNNMKYVFLLDYVEKEILCCHQVQLFP